MEIKHLPIKLRFSKVRHFEYHCKLILIIALHISFLFLKLSTFCEAIVDSCLISWTIRSLTIWAEHHFGPLVCDVRSFMNMLFALLGQTSNIVYLTSGVAACIGEYCALKFITHGDSVDSKTLFKERRTFFLTTSDQSYKHYFSQVPCLYTPSFCHTS